jgi:hypothetical protein
MVTDNKCSPVIFISGDTNNDSKLDVNETWKYRCLTTLSETTTNTVTATGRSDEGLTVSDTANATVIVSVGIPQPQVLGVSTTTVPTFPNTGIAPNEKNLLGGILPLLIGIFTISTMLIVVKRKQTI